MEVAHLHAIFGQVIGEVFGHALGQGGDQHPLLFVGPLADFAEQIIHLALGGTHLHDRIEHAGGANHLLHDLALALGHLPGARSGANKDRLLGLLPELIALERPVIGGRGQAEAVLNQHLLAGLVAVVHGLQLGAGDMAFIHHQQPILREVIDQAFRRGAGGPASQVAGVVFDAVAIAHLLEHLQVVGGALLQPLGLQQTTFPVEQVEPVMQLAANLRDRPLQPLLGGHKVLGGIDVNRVETLQDLTGGGIDIADRFDLIAKQLNPHQTILIGRTDLEHIATHAETATGDFQVVTGVLVINQFPQRAA